MKYEQTKREMENLGSEIDKYEDKPTSANTTRRGFISNQSR